MRTQSYGIIIYWILKFSIDETPKNKSGVLLSMTQILNIGLTNQGFKVAMPSKLALEKLPAAATMSNPFSNLNLNATNKLLIAISRPPSNKLNDRHIE
jgi:hypothetical protein